jgi:hypothetical protein
MLVCGVRAIPIRAETIQDGNIQSSDEVAVRRSADRSFSEFKTETSCYFPRVLIKFHNAFSPFKRTTIDAFQ